MSERKMIYLCLAHMSEADLAAFVNRRDFFRWRSSDYVDDSTRQGSHEMTDWKERMVVCLSSGAALAYIALSAYGMKTMEEMSYEKSLSSDDRPHLSRFNSYFCSYIFSDV